MKVSNNERAAQASLILTGLMFAVPFLQPYHRLPIPSFYGEWLAFALGLAAALPLLRKALWHEPELPKVALAPIALIGLLGAQILLERVSLPEQALTAALYAAWAALLIVLGAALRREFGMTALATALAWALLAGGMLNALAGVLQHYLPSAAIDLLVAPKFSVAVYGNIGQANHFADYIALALASAAYLYARGSLRVRWAAACAVLLSWVLALSGSRSPWLYLGALAALALLLRGRAQTAEGGRLLRYSFCLLPGFIAAQWIVTLPFLMPEAGLLVTSGQRLFDAAGGIEARLQLAQEAWAAFIESPLLGAGWGRFSWHHFQYQALTGAAAAPGVFNHAHNLVLQLMAETGVLGVLAVVGPVLAWIRDRRSIALDIEHWWLLALLTVLAIHSMLELPLWYSNFLGIAAILLGAGASQSLKPRAERVARAAVAASIAIGSLNLALVVPAYRDFERLLFAQGGGAAIAADEAGFASGVMNVHRDPVLKPYLEVAVSSGITVSEDQLRGKLELNSRVMRFAPGNLVVYRQALLLAAAGEREAALQQLESAARVYPLTLPHAVAVLTELDRRDPARFRPLLELAAARSAELRARAVVK